MRQNLSVEEALEAVLSLAQPIHDRQTLALSEAFGRVLAENLVSRVNHPDQDDTALDGYAVRQADTLSATPEQPVRLQVIGEAPAGKPFAGVVGLGQAVQVFTGAPIPPGADATLMVEKTRREGAMVLLLAPASAEDIRRRGDDLQQGQTYLHRGDYLSAGRVGLAAAMGHPSVPVVRKPRVGILSTGDEVVEPGEPLPFGGVYNSNAYSLAGLAMEAGAEPVLLGKASDRIEEVQGKLAEAGALDLLLTSGGVSMGEYDVVRHLLEREGRIHFWKVRIQPGGPLLLAEWKGVKVLGLPGNPVSSMVTFFLFGRPFLFKLLSRRNPPYQTVQAISESVFRPNPSKRAYRRARLYWNGGWRVQSTGNQSSGVLRSMSEGNALVVLEAGVGAEAGERVPVIPLNYNLI
jgi:molybdopterin molybdotransferase